MAPFVAAPRSAAAQSEPPAWLSLDRLQITSLGAFVGRVAPSQLEPANLVGLEADYGEIAPNWRLVFNASYWESRYQDKVVRAFADSLHKSLADPNDHVVASRISLYDVTLGGDVRYTAGHGDVRPFAGVGFAGHVINAEGALIKGTFVEHSLDAIEAGTYVTAGFSLKLFEHAGVNAAARADLLSGFHSTQLRAGAAYYFGGIGQPQAGGAGGGDRAGSADSSRGKR